MMKLRVLAMALIAFTLISAKGGCSEESAGQPVVGEWTWVKTFCCGRNSVWTSPPTCNCTQSLSIRADGSFKLTKGDKIEEGMYQLRKGINDYQQEQGDSALTIQFNDQYPAYVEFIGDTLLLARGYMDFDNVYYVRKTSK